MKVIFAFFSIILMSVSCSEFSSRKDSVVYYEVSDEIFANPERGLYSAFELRPDFEPLNADFVRKSRDEGRSLIYLGFYLTDFMESDISGEFLERVSKCFNALRDGGGKCILRFAYKTDMYETGHPWDADEKWVLRHIEQLGPIMKANEDVICCVQAGFVGVWGEWYYTDHFFRNPKNSEDYLLRKKVLDALLAAVPMSRQVGVRTPAFKMKMYGWNLSDTLTVLTAHDGSTKSRVAAFNDCFEASENDEGTFDDETGRSYWKAETRYTFMGGETCAMSDYCRCGNTLDDMVDYHWSYLNKDYNKKVLSRWISEGCYDEIAQRLGYRLHIVEGCFLKNALTGKKYDVRFVIHNSGFAAPMNPRDAELVLVSASGEKTVYAIDCDPRTWFEGTDNEVVKDIVLPKAKGRYKLYLNLPDPIPSLHNDARYSIRLANKNIWDEATGYNLLTEIEIR